MNVAFRASKYFLTTAINQFHSGLSTSSKLVSIRKALRSSSAINGNMRMETNHDISKYHSTNSILFYREPAHGSLAGCLKRHEEVQMHGARSATVQMGSAIVFQQPAHATKPPVLLPVWRQVQRLIFFPLNFPIRETSVHWRC